MKTSIKKNYILNTAYQVLSLLTPLITAPYISRVLGAEGVGIYSFTSSIVAIFSIFAVLGTTSYAQRVIAQNRDDKYQLSKNFWEIAILCFITTGICSVCWIIYACYIDTNYQIYYLILTFQLVGTGLNITWLYAGLENFSIIVFRSFIVKVLSIILMFFAVRKPSDVSIYIAVLSISNFLGYLSMWLSVKKYVCKVSIKSLRIAPHFKQTMAYFIPTIAASVYTYLDKAMIGLITKSNFENGYYEQSQKIVTMSYTVVASINTVMSSRMSYLFAKGDKKQMQDRLKTGFAFVLTLSIPMTFGLAGIAHNFVPWFFGPGYDDVVLLLILRSPLVIILSLINYYADQYLLPSGQRVRSTKGVILGAGINFVCNFILIAKFGAAGAILATLIGEITICVCYAYMSKEYAKPRWFYELAPKRLLCGALMYLVVVFLGGESQGSISITIIQVCAGIVIYFGSLMLLKDRYLMELSRPIVAILKNKVIK